MRWHGDWVHGLDKRVLERLAEHGNAPAWMIRSDLHHGHGYVRRRCRTFGEAEFVQVERREGNADLWDMTTLGATFEICRKDNYPNMICVIGSSICPDWV